MADIVLKRLINDMSRIEGVNGAVVVARDGVVLASTLKDPESEGAISVFAGATAEEIASSLDLGDVKQVVIEGSDYRMMIIKHQDYFIGIMMDEHTSPLIIRQEVESLLQM
ncbi:MAG: roadblock/LC7 domain-containing protein [Candidatus Methanofastidiosia archaeon]